MKRFHLCDPVAEDRTEMDGPAPYIHENGEVICVMNDAGLNDARIREIGAALADAPEALRIMVDVFNTTTPEPFAAFCAIEKARAVLAKLEDD